VKKLTSIFIILIFFISQSGYYFLYSEFSSAANSAVVTRDKVNNKICVMASFMPSPAIYAGVRSYGTFYSNNINLNQTILV
jgi:hypothetical protein